MLDRILLNPDNRLLGSSTGDLSLYGGQTDSTMILREARGDDISAPRQEPLGGTAEVASDSGSEGAQRALTQASDGEAPESSGSPAMLAAGPFSFLQPLAPIHADAAQPGITTPAPAAPSGSIPGVHGSGAPLSPAGDAPDTPSENIAAALDGAPGTDGLGDLLSGKALHGLDSLAGDTLDGVGAVVGNTLEGAGSFAGGTLDGVGAAVGDALEGVGGVAGDALDGVGTAVTRTVDGVAGIAAPVLDGAASAAEPVLDSAASTVMGITDAVAPLTGGLSPLVDGTGDGVSATIGAVGSTVADVAEGASDALDGVAGSDPAGGVATLVSLVSVSDMFDLHPVDAPAPADASGDPGFAMLDALAADVPDTLLGTDHHDDGGAGDGGHDHLFGL